MRVSIFLLAIGLVTNAQAGDLQTCASIESDVARLECYDLLSGRAAGEERAAVKAAAAKKQAAPAAAPKPMPEEVFGKSVEDTQEAYARAAGIEEVSEIRATVAKVSKDGYGRVSVVLDNGQRWRQIRKAYFKVSEGDEVIVRKAALQSYTLQMASGGRGTKVRRVD